MKFTNTPLSDDLQKLPFQIFIMVKVHSLLAFNLPMSFPISVYIRILDIKNLQIQIRHLVFWELSPCVLLTAYPLFICVSFDAEKKVVFPDVDVTGGNLTIKNFYLINIYNNFSDKMKKYTQVVSLKVGHRVDADKEMKIRYSMFDIEKFLN